MTRTIILTVVVHDDADMRGSLIEHEISISPAPEGGASTLATRIAAELVRCVEAFVGNGNHQERAS